MIEECYLWPCIYYSFDLRFKPSLTWIKILYLRRPAEDAEVNFINLFNMFSIYGEPVPISLNSIGQDYFQEGLDKKQLIPIYYG